MGKNLAKNLVDMSLDISIPDLGPVIFLTPGSGISLFQMLDSTHISGMRKKLIPDPGAKKLRIRNIGQTP